MSDLLVRLYDLPEFAAPLPDGVTIRRALAPERTVVLGWVDLHFTTAWADECAVAFCRQPVSCFLAVARNAICGFAAYEATCRGFFGPLGVQSDWQGKQIGTALLHAGLRAMLDEGYAYAIIGGAGPADFFKKTVGAMEIEGSDPGIYRGMLRAGT